MGKRQRSPQEKKQLSLHRDRRNTYGANDKASRKNIPLSKAISHRAVRRVAKMQTERAADNEDARSELAESTITKRRLQKGEWQKGSDEPLGNVIKDQIKARKRRDGRKAHARAIRGEARG